MLGVTGSFQVSRASQHAPKTDGSGNSILFRTALNVHRSGLDSHRHPCLFAGFLDKIKAPGFCQSFAARPPRPKIASPAPPPKEKPPPGPRRFRSRGPRAEGRGKDGPLARPLEKTGGILVEFWRNFGGILVDHPGSPRSPRRTWWNPGGTLVDPYLRAAPDNPGAYLG